jgi:hypothetical protein
MTRDVRHRCYINPGIEGIAHKGAAQIMRREIGSFYVENRRFWG